MGGAKHRRQVVSLVPLVSLLWWQCNMQQMPQCFGSVQVAGCMCIRLGACVCVRGSAALYQAVLPMFGGQSNWHTSQRFCSIKGSVQGMCSAVGGLAAWLICAYTTAVLLLIHGPVFPVCMQWGFGWARLCLGAWLLFESMCASCVCCCCSCCGTVGAY